MKINLNIRFINMYTTNINLILINGFNLLKPIWFNRVILYYHSLLNIIYKLFFFFICMLNAVNILGKTLYDIIRVSTSFVSIYMYIL